MTNAFLRELDQFTGVLVFTTNLADTLDPAVERRIRFRLAFPAPGPADRLRIWRSFWREGIPREGPIDLERLSREFSFPGGRIRNAFLAAVSKALRHGAMRQEHLQEACSEEDQRGIGGNRNLKVIRGFSPES
jgi:SpoVK/Ycf46/Vps4 family AAA+-type ATPase